MSRVRALAHRIFSRWSSVFSSLVGIFILGGLIFSVWPVPGLAQDETGYGVGDFALDSILLSNPITAAPALLDKVIPGTSLTTSIVNALLIAISAILGSLAYVFLYLTTLSLDFFIDLAAYNNFINTPTVIVGWFMIRDLANMFFIVALLTIAIGTILGLEQYEWKKNLAKLVMAAILINFSRLILGLLIDVSHIITLTFLNALQEAAGSNIIQMFHLDKMLQLEGGDGSKIDALLGKDIREELFFASVASFLFSFVALLSVGAYMVLMLTRMVMLWLLIILSPLAFLFSAIPQTQSYAREFWEEFMKYIIVGPLLAFFLWLAFATLGNGDIMTEIRPVNTAENSNDLIPENSTLSAIMQYENFASYMIALAFLFAGLERVQKVGARGGSLVSGAASFGTKVATIAAGVAAGQWLAGKAGSAASGVGGKLVSPLTRMGRTAKAQLELQLGANAERRNMRAKELEKMIEDKKLTGVRALGASVWASIIETGGRKDKRVKDWEESVENHHKILEEKYAVGGEKAGKTKTHEAVRLQILQEKGATVKEKKYAEERQRQLDPQGHHYVAESEKALREAAANKLVTRDIKKSTELKEANISDDALLAIQRKARFRASTEARHAKELEEEFAGLNFREITDQLGLLADDLMNAGLSDEDRKRISENMSIAYALSMKRGSEEGLKAHRAAAQKMGLAPVNAGDREGAQLQFLKMMTGDMNLTSAADGMQRFIAIHGPDQANVLLRNFDTAFKHAASDGGVNMAGLINGTLDASGRATYHLSDDDEFKGDRDYFGNKSTPAKIADFQGIANRTFTRSKDGKTVSFGEETIFKTGLDGQVVGRSKGDVDTQAVAQVIKTLNALQSNTPTSASFKESLKKLADEKREIFESEIYAHLNDSAKEALRKIDSSFPEPSKPKP